MRYSVVIVGVGGQGVMLASRVIGECAMNEGYEVVASEVHGMAQRGGSVTAMVRFGEGVLSPLVPRAGAGLIVGFEPLETYRALSFANKNTLVVTDVERIVPMAVIDGNEKYPDVNCLLEGMTRVGLRVVALDATEMAEKAGTRLAVNSVLIGAASSMPNFPLGHEGLRSTLMASVPERFRKENESAFNLGRKAASKAMR